MQSNTSPNKYFLLKKFSAPIIVISLSVLTFIQFYFSYFIFPPVNDECLWVPHYQSPDSIVIVLKNVKKFGVTWNAGIRDGDTLISVDGKQVNSTTDITKILSKKAEGDSAVYKIKRNEKIFETKISIKKLIPLFNITLELFALIWLIAGYIVYSSKPYGEIQNKFFKVGILWALSNNSIFVKIPSHIGYFNQDLLQLINFSWLIAIAFLPFSIIDFFLVFPIKKKSADNRFYLLLKRIYPVIIILGYFIIKIFFSNLTKLKDFKYISELVIFSISIISVALSLILGFFFLLSSYKKIKDNNKKKPLKIIISAYIVSLLSAFYVFFLAKIIVGSIYNYPEFYIPVIFMLLLPIAFAYTIFKYSLMDVSNVVKNTFFYFLASLFVAGIYFFTIFLIGNSLLNFVNPLYQGLIIGLLFVLFVIFFQSTKDKFQEIITRKFYPEQYLFKEALIQFGRDIPSILSYNTIIKETEKVFSKTLGISPFAISLLDKNEFKIIIQNGLNEIEKITLKKTTNNSNEIPQVIEDLENYFVNWERLSEIGIQLAIKLSAREKLIGFVLLGIKKSGNGYTIEEISILTAAANQVAIALENARMYESEKKEIILHRDLEKARSIQRSLLPQKMPKIKNAEIFGEMLPAQWVGGDYYDVIPIDENRFYAVIGDVSGKGFSASFYMSKLQTMMHLLASEKLYPIELLKTLNNKIYPSLEKNYFITLSILLFDFEKQKVFYSRAGHTPLKTICCGTIKNYIPKGIAVGLDNGKLFDENIEQITIPIKKNEIFILYSDGVTETMNQYGNLLGDTFMDKILIKNNNLELKEIWNKFYGEIKKFNNDNQQQDDITFLFIRII